MNTLIAATIDSREPKWAKSLTFDGIPVSKTELSAGDYKLICSDGAIILVERKTVDDLLNTIKENRLFDQVARMKEETDWCYLLITGEIKSNKDQKVITKRGVTGWDVNAIWGAIATVQELGCVVMFCQDDFYLEETLLRIAKRDRTNKPITAKRQAVML